MEAVGRQRQPASPWEGPSGPKLTGSSGSQSQSVPQGWTAHKHLHMPRCGCRGLLGGDMVQTNPWGGNHKPAPLVQSPEEATIRVPACTGTSEVRKTLSLDNSHLRPCSNAGAFAIIVDAYEALPAGWVCQRGRISPPILTRIWGGGHLQWCLSSRAVNHT